MGEFSVWSRQVEDALERGQLAVVLAVRDLPFRPVFACARHDHIGAPLQDERVDVGRCDRR